MLISLFDSENLNWNGYIPEQAIQTDESSESSVPTFYITITTAGVDDNTTVQEVFTVPMTGYKDQKFNFGTDIFRNHIYVLSVENIISEDLNAEIVVVPYIGIELEPGFGFGSLLPGDHHTPPTGW
ncbi:MAG: hypothetical protein K2N25_06400 [Muribaculaceae bacterium]|nr:hypothetical protein [Muribaculaceae bacterium]